MLRSVRLFVCFLGALFLFSGQAFAASKGTFVVLPFVVNGPQDFKHLERSIPQMLTSRLYWQGNVESAGEASANQGTVNDATVADRVRSSMKADYVVYGAVTIVGTSYSLDTKVRDKSGKNWTFAHEGNTNQMMTGIRSVSDTINRQIFGRQSEVFKDNSAPVRTNQMNPDLVVNEDRPKDVYLNPQFRYSGSSTEDESRQRSQTLPFNSIGMEIVDADNDGRNEVFLLGKSTLYAYRFEGSRLQSLGEISLPATTTPLAIRSLPVSGKAWIVVSMVDKDALPQSYIYTFSNGKFTEIYSRQRYFLNVVSLAPDYRPVLLGQKSGRPRLFASQVLEMLPGSDGNLVEGTPLALPEDANVFNFTHVPGAGTTEGDKIIVLNKRERLRTYTIKGARLAESDGKFSGAAIGIEENPAMHGLARDDATMGDMYYIPMRMVPSDIENDGKYELLVNKPISTASSIFDRYRFYPQSEIHSLFWDGIGLNLQWKTRRIKGSTVDYTLADANNDGILDLAVCINTHPGAVGAQTRKTVVLIYPLDIGLASPDTAPYISDE